MTSHKLIIIGGGAAASAAALAAPHGQTLVLDVGEKPASQSVALPHPSRLEALGQPGTDLFDLMIGPDFDGTALVGGDTTLSPKLKAPLMRYITRNWERLSPVTSKGFDPQMSFSKGGLANAWGAGVYRFNDTELEGFPIQAKDLEPFYDTLTQHIGVSGATDDLSTSFGSTKHLQPPLRMNRGPRLIHDQYRKHHAAFNGAGFRIGRPRLAVLSHEHQGRSAYSYNNLEFFTPNDQSIYSPDITLRKLQSEGRIEYVSGLLVESYHESSTGVEVRARDLRTHALHSFKADRIAIAAGCLNSAKIVLRSEHRIGVKLPLLDNVISYVPLLNPALIGARAERRCFGMGQLNIIYEGARSKESIQGTLYDLSGPLRSDIIMDFPLANRGKLAASRLLAQAMCLVQFFYPDDPKAENTIELTSEDQLSLNYSTFPRGEIERAALSIFRKIGWFGLPALCKFPPPGSSYHYAGSLPMQKDPKPLQTSPAGQLAGRNRVYVVDSAVFSRLPSKNLTFTSMANAMRIIRGMPNSPP